MDRPQDIRHPRFARVYLRYAEGADRAGVSEHRRRLLDGLRGTVVEVGAGQGLNFRHYPQTVTSVTAIEPEPTLRAMAERAAREAPVPVTVSAGTADALPLADGSVDAAVVSLVLCSVPDQRRALAELHRVIRPGGELRFYEHVIPSAQPLRAILQAAERSGIWPRLAGGCHPARDTEAAIAARFEIEACDLLLFAPHRYEPRIPHILGRARRPADDAAD